MARSTVKIIPLLATIWCKFRSHTPLYLQFSHTYIYIYLTCSSLKWNRGLKQAYGTAMKEHF